MLNRRVVLPNSTLWVAVFQDPDGEQWIDWATATPDLEMCQRRARCQYHPRRYDLVSVLCVSVTYLDENVIP
jgi:hypothetical protein